MRYGTLREPAPAMGYSQAPTGILRPDGSLWLVTDCGTLGDPMRIPEATWALICPSLAVKASWMRWWGGDRILTDEARHDQYNPSVVRYGGQWVQTYTGTTWGSDHQEYLGLAVSEDLVSWQVKYRWVRGIPAPEGQNQGRYGIYNGGAFVLGEHLVVMGWDKWAGPTRYVVGPNLQLIRRDACSVPVPPGWPGVMLTDAALDTDGRVLILGQQVGLIGPGNAEVIEFRSVASAAGWGIGDGDDLGFAATGQTLVGTGPWTCDGGYLRDDAGRLVRPGMRFAVTGNGDWRDRERMKICYWVDDGFAPPVSWERWNSLAGHDPPFDITPEERESLDLMLAWRRDATIEEIHSIHRGTADPPGAVGGDPPEHGPLLERPEELV